MIVLITGPVRSGKSAFALELARASARTPVYVATYEDAAGDAEMAERIARHRAERGAMRTVETDERHGPSLVATLAGAGADELLIVDSVGTWLAGQLLALEALAAADPVEAGRELERRAAPLAPAVAVCAADVVLVSEETGWGVVPPSGLGRIFRDQLGRTTAELARRADQTWLVVAGHALDLGGTGRRLSG